MSFFRVEAIASRWRPLLLVTRMLLVAGFAIGFSPETGSRSLLEGCSASSASLACPLGDNSRSGREIPWKGSVDFQVHLGDLH